MSLLAVRAALETALAAMAPSLATAWENSSFSPVVGTPYQHVHLLMARPARVEASGTWSRAQGYLQIDLKYPLNAGPAPAAARAKLIQDTFPDASTFTASGVTTHIEGEAEVMPGRTEADRYVVTVKVYFYANIRRS